MKTLTDKVVAITGAGSGIGRALAREAAARGARLALSDRDVAAAAETATLCAAKAVMVRQVDVRRDEDLRAFAAATAAELGGVDVLVNNAGVSLTDRVEDMSREDFAWLFDINFWGVVRGTEAFLPLLRQAPEGHLVNVSSMFGLVGAGDQSAYAASKFAVRGYSESLAQELVGTPVRVTCVFPGAVRTNIIRAGRGPHGPEGADRAALAQRFEAVAMTSPEVAAVQIWRGVLRNAPRVLVGADAWLFDVLVRWFPTFGPAMVRFLLTRATQPRP